MLPLQIPGGPELIILFLLYAVAGLLPIVAALVAVYLLYKLRQDTKSMARSLRRLADTQSASDASAESTAVNSPADSTEHSGK